MSKIAIAALCLMATNVTSGFAEQFSYDHNNSEMVVDVRGNRVTIRYENPKQSLRKHGVRRGTLLFEGKIGSLDDGSPYLDGDARIFRQGCAPTPYFVYGAFRAGRDFTINGAAPVLAKGGCRIVDNVSTGANAYLKFRAIAATPKAEQNQPREDAGYSGRLCVTGVNTTLNMRVGPGANYGRIGELPANACDVVSFRQCIDGWCAVQRRNEIGWVSNRYIRPN